MALSKPVNPVTVRRDFVLIDTGFLEECSLTIRMVRPGRLDLKRELKEHGYVIEKAA